MSALPRRRWRWSAMITRRQRNARLESLQFNPGAGAGPQQTVGRLAQPSATGDRISGKRGIKGCEERRDIAINSLAQGLVDKRTAVPSPLRRSAHAKSVTMASRGVAPRIALTAFDGVLLACRRARGNARDDDRREAAMIIAVR